MPKSFYVTVRKGGLTYPMAGPYSTHEAALADAQQAMDAAYGYDGSTWFMDWGTTSVDLATPPAGRLNALGLM